MKLVPIIVISLFICYQSRIHAAERHSKRHHVPNRSGPKTRRRTKLSLRVPHKDLLVITPNTPKVKLGEVYLTGADRLRGEKGKPGLRGRRGMRGKSGHKGEKGDSASCDPAAIKIVWSCTDVQMEGAVRYSEESGTLEICSNGKWQSFELSRVVFPNTTPRKSCLETLFVGESRGDGMYWLNPFGQNDNRNAFRAYCDMTTSGGGWTLVAKVTHDYSWICPEWRGEMCYRSKADPLTANLFHPIHQRDSVDLSIADNTDAGIHLNNSIIRKIFVNGRQSLRLTFVNSRDGWTPTEDAYAAFHPGRENKLFVDNHWGSYSRQQLDYTWNIITHVRKSKKFGGQFICWGNNVEESYRFYDHGLHVGSPALGEKPCHLANDEHEVMLKSHYAMIDSGPPLKGHWDIAQFGFLNAKYVQVPNKRIAVWVR